MSNNECCFTNILSTIEELQNNVEKIEDVNKFFKEPDSTVGEFKYELPEKLSLDLLVKAFSDMMQKMTIKAEVVQEKKIVKDRFTVAQKISHIKDMLITKKEFKFKNKIGEVFNFADMFLMLLPILLLLFV